MESSEGAPAPVTGASGGSLFKSRKRPGFGSQGRSQLAGIRQRQARDSSSSSSSDPDSDSDNVEGGSGESTKQSAVVKIKRAKMRGLGAGTQKHFNLKSKIYESESSSSSSDEEADQKRKEGLGQVIFKASGSTANERSDQNATAINEIDTDISRDAHAIEERGRSNREQLMKDGNVLEDKVYRGMNSYAKFLEKKDTPYGSSAKMSTGPQRAPANVRATVRWDYEPNLCKDFKETGFCGFGDTCKFMHDRSDYKFGWQLEREMEEGTYGMDDEDDNKYLISSDDEDLPFKCFICKDSFKHPVVTKCKHYFCEKCALTHYKKTHRCFACGKNTNGVFNPAKEIIAKLEKAKNNS